jgi:hypothetical protein
MTFVLSSADVGVPITKQNNDDLITWSIVTLTTFVFLTMRVTNHNIVAMQPNMIS